MTEANGLLALFIFFCATLLVLVPVILLRRLWNSRQNQPTPAGPTTAEQAQLVFPKYFLPLLLTLVGCLFLLLWSQVLATEQGNQQNIWHLLAIGAALNVPWILALLYSWKKGTFNNDRQ